MLRILLFFIHGHLGGRQLRGRLVGAVIARIVDGQGAFLKIMEVGEVILVEIDRDGTQKGTHLGFVQAAGLVREDGVLPCLGAECGASGGAKVQASVCQVD